MIKSIVKIRGDNYIYKGKVYDYYSFLKEVKFIKYAVLLILEQNIYVRNLELNFRNITEDEINNRKEREFGKDEEYLIHYEILKKEKRLYMYAVSGGKKISYISKYFKDLEVIPIQMYIQKKLKHKIKDKSYQCLFLYGGVYYYINVKNGYIIECHMWRELCEARNLLIQSNNESKLYVQIGVDLKGNNIIFIDFGDIYDEKILCK